MEKEKVLGVEFKEVWDNKWAWKITKNKIDFKNTGGEISFNRIKLTCANKYDLYIFGSYFLKWELLNSDNLIDLDLKIDIQDFVNYINEKYGTPKRWRARNCETYYIINDIGYIISHTEDFTQTDSTYYNLGNYFKSPEEAIKFRDTVWKDLWIQRKETYKD